MHASTGFCWKHESNIKLLYYGEEFIGELLTNTAEGIHCAKFQIDEVEHGVFKISKEFVVKNNRQPAYLILDFVTNYNSNWSMIPAVSYNGNNWGKGGEPKGFAKDGTPWSFSYSRMSVPGATYSEGKKWSAAFFGDLESSDFAFSCSLIPREKQTIHRIIWPEEESPYTYYQRDKYREAFKRTLDLDVGDTFSITAYLVVGKITSEKVSYDRMLDFAWKLHYHKQEPWFLPQEIWRLGITYARETLYVEDGIFRGFSKGLRWDGKSWYLRPTGKYLVGWTGQNLSLANSMIYSYIMTGNKADLDMGLNTLDTWANYSRLENGLIRCLFDPILEGIDKNRGVQDACNLADAALNFFEAWELLKKCNISKNVYKEAALGICDFAVSHQFKDGRFGKSWKNDGSIADPDGTIGCYLVLPLLKAYNITGQAKYLESAERGYEFYLNSFLTDGYTSAAALDTYCIDKESAIPLLKSSMQLYDIKKHDRYIKHAVQASYYLATWQWHYTIPFPEGTTLRLLNYDTFGGTSVSTQHHHIDPFAITFIKEWFRLAELTGKDIWRQRAKAVWANGTFGISDGNLVVNEAKRPVGSQDEGFFHTYWGAPNNVSSWLVAWPTAFRLEILRHLRDWDQLHNHKEGGDL